MLDNIDDLHKMMRHEGISYGDDSEEIEEEENNDRELIQEFMRYTYEAQERIAKIERTN